MNNSMIFLQALEGVDAGFVAQAKPGKAKKRTVFCSAVATAACIALLLTVLPKNPGTAPGGVSLQSAVGTKPTEPTETTILVDPPEPPVIEKVASKLPMLKTSGGGAWAYMAYDVSEIVHNQSWSTDAITTLPVYRNLWVRDGAGMPPEMDATRREMLIQQVAQQLEELAVDAEIRVEDGYCVTVIFADSIEIPDAYKASYFSDYKQVQAMATYLLDTYGDVFGLESPVTDIWGGDRYYDGQQTYHIRYYEGAGTDTQQLIERNFQSVGITWDENGNWRGLSFNNIDLSEKVADYELITVEQAQERLYQGYFTCSFAPAEMRVGRKMCDVELMYYTSGFGDYFIPYYKILLEAEDEWFVGESELGLKTYVVYLVPAIDLDAYCELTGAQILE